MKKIAIAVLIGGVLWIIAGCCSSENPASMTDGYYRIYSIQKAFDTKTGEAIYWIVADKVKYERIYGHLLPIHQNKIKFYEIPRGVIENLSDKGNWETPIPAVLLNLKNGKGTIEWNN